MQYLAESGDELETLLDDAGVPYDSDPQLPNTLISTLITVILPVVLIAGVLLWVMNRSQGGGGRVMQFGRSRHKTVSKDQPKTTFADVAGVDEAIEELEEVKEYLQSPAKFQAMGAKIPRGVLLFGPPGTGKTLLARAVAGEAGVPFFSISGSDFVEMFVGVGAARVRDLFEQAKAAAPAIVFIDEIDAVGRHRGAGLGGGHDEREQTLNQLLVEMDGFDQRSTVILMAATNRPDILDPALLRPGRFDRQVVIDRPDLEGRKAILKVHARGKPFDATVDLAVLARRTPGLHRRGPGERDQRGRAARRAPLQARDLDEGDRGGRRPRDGRTRAEVARDGRGGAPADRVPRGRARHGRAHPSQHRRGPQDHRDPARTGAGLHAHAPRAGQVPDDARAAARRARDADGRPGRRGDRGGRRHDGRARTTSSGRPRSRGRW